MKTGGIPYVAVMNRTDDCVTEDNCQVSGKRYWQPGVYEKYNRLSDFSGKESIPEHSQ